MPQVNAATLALIKEFEGCPLTAYHDAVGVLTIGWGHTGPVNGQAICEGMTITQDTADAELERDLTTFEAGVNNLVSHVITPNQFGALVSFAYNVGLAALGTSTLLAYVNASEYPQAAAEFGKWVFAGGQVLEGLVRRRAAEAKLFETPG